MVGKDLLWQFENTLVFDLVTGSSDGGTEWGSS
jgi:hypothetical protein